MFKSSKYIDPSYKSFSQLFSTTTDSTQPHGHHNSVTSNNEIEYGEFYPIIASNDPNIVKKHFTDIKSINTSLISDESNLIWIRGRVNSVRVKGSNLCFINLRSDAFYTVQCVHFEDKLNVDVSKQLIKYVANIPIESIVDILGVVVPAEVKSWSQDDVEIQI